MSNIKFRHICILVSDIEKSLKFYRDLLGFKVTKQQTLSGEFFEKLLGVPNGKLTYVKMLFPNQEDNEIPMFELHCWEAPRTYKDIATSHISLTVTDIWRTFKKLRKEGIDFASEPIKSPYNNTLLCFCSDPDFNLIELVEDLE